MRVLTAFKKKNGKFGFKKQKWGKKSPYKFKWNTIKRKSISKKKSAIELPAWVPSWLKQDFSKISWSWNSFKRKRNKFNAKRKKF